jgi:putative restriction endonuclease
MVPVTSDQWLRRLATLKVDRASGNPAPHKPLLLLVVIELAEQRLLPKTLLPLTPELAFRFCTYWSIVAHRRTQKPDVRYPFYHLQSDGCWTALGEDGRPAPERRSARCAQLNSDFEACLNDPTFREQARTNLICKYFSPDEHLALCSLLELPVPSCNGTRSAAAYQSAEQAEQTGREARFRINIISAYNYSCALTGYRLLTISSESIIDAAHIHQFADSRNNNIRNGIALCKNAHWLFDNGLWTIADDYTVKVALGSFSEDSPDQKALSSYHGHMIRLPGDATLSPDPIHLAWHRNNVFVGSA